MYHCEDSDHLLQVRVLFFLACVKVLSQTGAMFYVIFIASLLSLFVTGSLRCAIGMRKQKCRTLLGVLKIVPTVRARLGTCARRRAPSRRTGSDASTR